MARPFVRLLSAVLFVPIAAVVAEAQAPVERDEQVRLRPGDRILLAIQDEPRLSDTVYVDQAGNALFPLVGLTGVTGEPFGRVRERVQAAYGRELVDQAVQLTPLLRVAVIGEVRNPGVFAVDPTRTISDVLATAGGLTPDADREGLSLVREGEVVSGSLRPDAPLLATPVLSGDQLVVDRESWFVRNSTIFVGAATSVAAAALTALIVR